MLSGDMTAPPKVGCIIVCKRFHPLVNCGRDKVQILRATICESILTCIVYPGGPSLQVIPTLAPKVYRYHMLWAKRIFGDSMACSCHSIVAYCSTV